MFLRKIILAALAPIFMLGSAHALEIRRAVVVPDNSGEIVRAMSAGKQAATAKEAKAIDKQVKTLKGLKG